MANLKKVYGLVGKLRDPLVDLSMAQALPTAGGVAQEQLVRMMLERGHQPALTALVRHFHELSLDLQKVISARSSDMEAAIRSAAADPDKQTRLNAINMITQSRSYHLAYLLSAQLQQERVAIHRAAASGLLELGWLLHTASNRGTNTRAAFDVTRATALFTAALVESCASYHKHREHMVLMAAACVAPRKPSALMERLTNRRSAVHTHLRKVIHQLDHHLINRALLCYLGVPALRSAVVDALRRPEAAPRLGQLLASAYLLAVPVIRDGLRQVGHADHLIPDDKLMRRLGPSERYQVSRWMGALNANPAKKAAVMTQIVSTDDRLMRLLGLRALIAMKTRAADDRVVAMCMDADPTIARIAMRHLVLRRWVGLTKLMGILVDAAHPDIRRMAERHLLSVGFNHLWDKWDRLPTAMRLSAGRVLVKANDNFRRRLVSKMRMPDPAVRFKALQIARLLDQCAPLQHQLLRMLDDEDGRVASSAAAALGHVPGAQRSTRAMVDLLNHRNDRVRANAIEAFGRLKALDPLRDVLAEIAVAGLGNRSSANAALELARLGDPRASAAMEKMLGHPRARHRVSALWALERSGLRDMKDTVARLATDDSDPEVRARAARVLERLAAAQGEEAGAEAEA